MGAVPRRIRTVVPLDSDVAGGWAADPGDGLGVEQDEQPGEAVPAVQRVIVQQATGGVPAGLLIHCPRRALPLGSGVGHGGEALPGGPADKVPRVVAVGRSAAGQPLVEVSLAAGGQGQVPGGQPVQQGDGGADLLMHDVVGF
jgi:hypothetical protein